MTPHQRAIYDALRREEVASTQEVADAAGVGRKSAHSALRALAREGWVDVVSRRPVPGARCAVVWCAYDAPRAVGRAVLDAKVAVTKALGEAAFPVTAGQLARETGLTEAFVWRALAYLAAEGAALTTDDGRWVA